MSDSDDEAYEEDFRDLRVLDASHIFWCCCKGGILGSKNITLITIVEAIKTQKKTFQKIIHGGKAGFRENVSG